MSEVLAKFMEVTQNPYEYIARWKEHNKRKVIGCYPMHIPEELIYAAGMLPVVVWRGYEPITMGLPYAPTHHCGFARAFIDDMVVGRLKILDGLVFQYLCLVARGAHFSAMRHNPPPYLKYIVLPLQTTAAARDAGIVMLEDFQRSLEECSEERITEESLRRSIQIYNENRRLLQRLYELRRQKPGLLRAKEVAAIVNASMLMPKEEHNELLRQLLEDLETKQPAPKGKIKIALSGHFCHAPRWDVLDLIEELGGVVVDDDLYCGFRYFAEDVEIDEAPVVGLLERFMKRIPVDPTKVDPEGKRSDWGDFLVSIVKRSGAQGIISLMVKFCPPHQEWHPDVKRVLQAARIPELMIQVEHEAVSLAPIRTRIEAFVESLYKGEQ